MCIVSKSRAVGLDIRSNPGRATLPPAMASGIERQVLTGPDWVARAAASAIRDRRARWMLRQPREVRLSYARECFGKPDEAKRAEAWMLHQSDDVRHSYVAEVLRV